MHLTNLHTHTLYCDGMYSAEDMILAAINLKFQSIGISTHGPTPFVSDWNIQSGRVENYMEEITVLKEKYKNQIDVLLGMELDYIPGIGFDELSRSLIKRLDYYIGSVHYLGYFESGIMWTVDYNLEELTQGIKESFGGNARHAVELYYKMISEMATNYQPPIIGHLDLFKKNNKDNALFDEKEDWYVKAVENCLKVIKNTSCSIEINTGGIARGYTKEQYPSTFILKMIKDMEIPVVINSDAHTKEGIDCKFTEMYDLVRELGFNSLNYLTKEGWSKQNI